MIGARKDGVPELLPDRDELVRAQVAAHWITTGERGDPLAEPRTVELCTRVLRVAGVDHRAADGHRLRIRVSRTTRQIGVLEEPDTGPGWVWDEFAPHELAPRLARRPPPGRPSALAAEPTAPASLLTALRAESRSARAVARADSLQVAESTLRSIAVAVHHGLPAEPARRFRAWLRQLDRVLDELGCWDGYYGRAEHDDRRTAEAAADLGLGGGELALVGAVAALSRWCDEPVVRCAVEGLAHLGLGLRRR